VLRYQSLIEALEAAPGDRPFITFWVDEDEQESVTFAEFRCRARMQASTLREQGAICGDRIVIIMPQGISAMTVFAGAMMLGAVPAFLAYPNERVEPSKYRSGLAGVTANLGTNLVVIDQGFPEEMLGCVSLTEGAKFLRADTTNHSQEATLSEIDYQSNHIAFIQHSAGTTGLQKGVALTHAAVLRQLQHLAGALQITSEDRIYSWLPLYHDMGLIACFMLPMVCHVPVVMQSPIEWVMQPETILQVISEHKCSLAWMPNFAFQFVPRRTRPNRRTQYDLSSLRALINCSEPVRASSMQEFRDAFTVCGLRSGVLQSSYAMAENVFAVTQSDLNGASGPKRIWADGSRFRSSHQIEPVLEATPGAICFTSSGRLLPSQQIRIISDSGSDLPNGMVGEILVKSDCLFDGYYNRPDLTALAIVDGWYRTGDLGFFLDGELYVVGRKKDLIIVGGENLYPQDIEEIVGRHPAIHDGRVIATGLYNPDLGTEEILVVAEVEREELLVKTETIEREIRSQVTAALGVTVGTTLLKPPKWIVKSTAGKPARSTTLEKMKKEHPDLNIESWRSRETSA
jgi:acyl-CoA synthetase (AMP-forming)/AMP-acid ligase II